MKSEIDIAFELLRAALEGHSLETADLEASQWWSLFRLLQKNHVEALCFDALVGAKVPREVLMPWLSEREKAADWYRHQEKVQTEVTSAMKKHGIETLVLKGTHLAQYYPRPEAREFGDLDLYFYDRHDEADAVARKELCVAVSNDSHHHTKYNYHGVTVESHYDFLNTHYPTSNRRYESLLKELAPSPTFEILFLLRHMAGHFAASRITLRDLIDWTLTCRALHDKADWTLIQETLDHYGMGPFVATLGTIAEKRLGVQLPLHDEADRQTLFRVEHDMVYGNPLSDHPSDGFGRLGWKIRRWRALAWKRRMVYNDSGVSLFFSSLTSHAEKPHSILHKM